MSETFENSLGASVQGLIYDCDDPDKLSKFYAKLLGGTLHADPYSGYYLETPLFGLGFQLDEDYVRPVWPGTKGDQLQMLHIDIRVDNQEKAVEYALSIGATLPSEQFCQPDWEAQWITLLDPAGHPFCLFEEY